MPGMIGGLLGAATAARTGYVQGEMQGEQQRKAEQRQMMLDQERHDAALRAAQMAATRQALAELMAQNTRTHQDATLAETVRNHKEMEAAAKARNAIARQRANQSGSTDGGKAVKAQLSTVNGQIDDTRASLGQAQREKPKPKAFYLSPSDSVQTVTAQRAASDRMRTLSTRLDSLTGVRDSLAAVQQGRPTGGHAPVDPKAEQRAAWDRAAEALRARKQDPTSVLGPRP